ncbi:cyclin-like protein interacting with PHO85 [Dispira parvispora]|uniref:Cyclin-like protein interacting with PHO85 n=1 Tax=Dispira parvispora TaxID=1520584 RepID=A0A9W8ALD0_9FUNG|nr:cyclin-like protein interacting with PHO85 [Dispira parvispora]
MSQLNVSQTSTKDTIRMVAECFQTLVTENDINNHKFLHRKEYNLHKAFTSQSSHNGGGHHTLTLFHSRGVPSIDLYSYLNRILKYCPCPNECFVSLLIYLRRITERCQKSRTAFSVDPYSVHRLIIAGITTSSKYFSDLFYTNSRYARVGGVHVDELNMLELEFLKLLGFELYVTPEELQDTANLVATNTLPNLFATYPIPQSRIPTPPSPVNSRVAPGVTLQEANGLTFVPHTGRDHPLAIQPPSRRYMQPHPVVTPVTPSEVSHASNVPMFSKYGAPEPSVQPSLVNVRSVLPNSGGLAHHAAPTPPRTPTSASDQQTFPPGATVPSRGFTNRIHSVFSHARPIETPSDVNESSQTASSARHGSMFNGVLHHLFDRHHHHSHSHPQGPAQQGHPVAPPTLVSSSCVSQPDSNNAGEFAKRCSESTGSSQHNSTRPSTSGMTPAESHPMPWNGLHMNQSHHHPSPHQAAVSVYSQHIQ